jgi:hypothetical protein
LFITAERGITGQNFLNSFLGDVCGNLSSWLLLQKNNKKGKKRMEKERRELVDRLSLVVAERVSDLDFQGLALAIVRKKMVAMLSYSAGSPKIA